MFYIILSCIMPLNIYTHTPPIHTHTSPIHTHTSPIHTHIPYSHTHPLFTHTQYFPVKTTAALRRRLLEAPHCTTFHIDAVIESDRDTKLAVLNEMINNNQLPAVVLDPDGIVVCVNRGMVCVMCECVSV